MLKSSFPYSTEDNRYSWGKRVCLMICMQWIVFEEETTQRAPIDQLIWILPELWYLRENHTVCVKWILFTYSAWFLRPRHQFLKSLNFLDWLQHWLWYRFLHLDYYGLPVRGLSLVPILSFSFTVEGLRGKSSHQPENRYCMAHY